MLFYMLQHYSNIQTAVINDSNLDLIAAYKTVRDHTEKLILSLHEIEKAYLELAEDSDRKEFFLSVRSRYNQKQLDPIENTTCFIFLNKTCFNGLYRVNKRGGFNVPFGKYDNPQICNEGNLLQCKKILQKVRILSGDFEETFSYAKANTLFYFDPPYRPLSDTSSFNSYTKNSFNDEEQVRLKKYCDKVDSAGFKFMLSNSDGRGKDEKDNFFDNLYKEYHINRVVASRSVNSNPHKRGKLTEILVHNYKKTKFENNGIVPLNFSHSPILENQNHLF